ncbi:MAG TPA: heterodisulfide reductase-related iron-sulfur binding cluster, partial [Nocardioidaceae bacterium]|nr:heterodisulfide reductase-related iron-sulfur binding cluster [Nocardioidaceae bacterium]
LAMQNAEVFKETKVKKVVSTCAHCFNTLKNEYVQFGIELEVVHHTQLLNRLVREGKLTPVAANGGPSRAITYHDPCYLGRHNQVYSPPRELLDVIPNAEMKEMPRNSERSFCCGAGGARMWMEEKLGERINLNRTTEAVETGADQIATGCPFCRVMLSDGLTAKQADGSAREEVEVLDVAQLLLSSVKRGPHAASRKKRPAEPAAATATAGAGTTTAVLEQPNDTDGDTEPAAEAEVQTKAEPEPTDVTQTEDTVTDTAEVGAAAQATPEDAAEATPDPAADTEPKDVTAPDPDSTDVSDTDEGAISAEESTAPEDDAATRNQREAAAQQQETAQQETVQQETAKKPDKPSRGGPDDTLF